LRRAEQGGGKEGRVSKVKGEERGWNGEINVPKRIAAR
jgi:hypothetical protein